MWRNSVMGNICNSKARFPFLSLPVEAGEWPITLMPAFSVGKILEWKNVGKRIPGLAVLSSVQLLSHVQLFATPWIAAGQAFLSITNCRSLPKPMSIESVKPYNHLILYHPLIPCPQSFTASVSFQMSQLFSSGGQSIGASASTSVLPMNTQDWSPLGWTGWISLHSKELLRVFSNTTVQKHQLFSTQLSL